MAEGLRGTWEPLRQLSSLATEAGLLMEEGRGMYPAEVRRENDLTERIERMLVRVDGEGKPDVGKYV